MTTTSIAMERPESRRATGPTTPQGKAASRVNALKSGLSGRGLILPEHEADLARVRRHALQKAFKVDPDDTWASILIETIAVESVRTERCRQEEALIRERAAAEAATLWDENRTLDSLQLGSKLADDPESVRIELEKTRFGVEWMIGRWAILNHALEQRGTWSADEEELSLHLLGTPDLLRESMRKTPPDGLKTIIDRETARLHALRGSRIALDEDERDLAEVGISADAEKRLRTVRRYESASRRAMEKAREELRRHVEESTARPLVELTCEGDPSSDGLDYETNPSVDEPAKMAMVRHDGSGETPAMADSIGAVSTLRRHSPTLPMNRKKRRAREARLRRA